MTRLIDADALMNAFNEAQVEFDECYKGLGRAKAITDSAPTVERPKGKWIPVRERLPEDRELILFSTKTDRVFQGKFFEDNTDRQWYSFRDDAWAWNNVVTAWQPLPEPYKEADNEQQRG